MKKVLLAALVGVAGYLGYKKMQAAREEQDLWAEATDSVAPSEPTTAATTPPTGPVSSADTSTGTVPPPSA
jgi:hypothetical protein